MRWTARTTRRNRRACPLGKPAQAGWASESGGACPASFTGLARGQTGHLWPGNFRAPGCWDLNRQATCCDDGRRGHSTASGLAAPSRSAYRAPRPVRTAGRPLPASPERARLAPAYTRKGGSEGTAPRSSADRPPPRPDLSSSSRVTGCRLHAALPGNIRTASGGTGGPESAPGCSRPVLCPK
jgi:hypothetical protein